MSPRLLPFVAALLTVVASPLVRAELPPAVRADQLLLEAQDRAKWDDWDGVVAIFETIRAENLPVPDDFEFRYGEALAKARQHAKAQSVLAAYVQRRRGAADYEAALKLLVDVERRIASERAERAREIEEARLAEVARAEADRARAEQRAKEFQRRGVTLREGIEQAESEVFPAIVLAGASFGATVLIVTALQATTSFPFLVFGGIGFAIGGLEATAIGTILGWSEPMTRWVAPIAASLTVLGLGLAAMFVVDDNEFVPLAALGILSWTGGALTATGLCTLLSAKSRIAHLQGELDTWEREAAAAKPRATLPPTRTPLGIAFAF